MITAHHNCACPPGDTFAVCRRQGLYGDGVDGRSRGVDTEPALGGGADTEGHTMAQREGIDVDKQPEQRPAEAIAERVAWLRDFEARAVALEEQRRADFDAWCAEVDDHIAALTAGGHGVEEARGTKTGGASRRDIRRGR